MNKISKLNPWLFCLCISLILLPGICLSLPADDSEFFEYTDDADYNDYVTTSDDDYYDNEPIGFDEYDSSDTEEYGEDYPPEEEQEVVEPSEPKIKAGAPINLAEKEIRIGRTPFTSIKRMMKQVVPLLGILKKKTGAKQVRFVSSAKSYSNILTALARKKIDFAWVSPAAYLKHKNKDELMAIAKAKFGETTAYRGVFIAPTKGKVQGLEDLANSKIGFVDRSSASGYIYPMYLLKKLRINLGKKPVIKFLKNHENVLNAVARKKIDAGVCLEATLNDNKKLRNKVIILAKTPEVPSDVIVCRKDCPLNLREAFIKALISLTSKELPAQSPTFLSATDEEFASVEEILRYVGLIK